MRKVPKLRFKEFSDEWEKLNAEEIFENISNKKHNGDLPVLAVTQDKGVVSRDSLDLKINSSEEGIKNYKIIEPGNFIISLRSFQGGIEYSDILGIGSPAYTVLKSKKNIEDIFYKFYLKKSSFISELNKTIEGIRDGKQISYSMFSKLKLPYPSIEEQEKIANFLSSIDKKISLTEEKLELFREYKKGVMQKIFSQELRFKDSNGNDYPEWEEKTLNEILIESKQKNTENKYKEVFSVAKFEGVVNQVEHLGRSFASKDISNYKIVNPYDIIYTKSPVSDFPYGIIKQNKLNRTGVVSVLYAVFKPKTSLIGLLLDYYFSLSKNTNNYLYALINKGAKNTININNDTFLKGNLISLPSSVEEQQKIADFLSSIDNKIESIEKELGGLKEFKKGLLQQMFV